MSRWVDWDACPCNGCAIKDDCINWYNGECDKYIKWKQGVDVAPVKHGRWVKNKECKDYWDMSCSVCGAGVDTKVHHYLGFSVLKYCPYCGARMDAEEINGNMH